MLLRLTCIQKVGVVVINGSSSDKEQELEAKLLVPNWQKCYDRLRTSIKRN